MTDGRVNLSGTGTQTLYMNNYRTGQDQAGNYSSYRTYGIYEGNNYGSYTGNPQYWSNSIGQSGSITIPYASRNGSITLYDTYWNRGHDGNGYASDFNVSTSFDSDHTSIGDGTVTVYEGAPPRIPKVPSAPRPQYIDTITADTMRYVFIGPADDGGTGMIEYEVQRATNSGFTTGVTSFTTTSGTNTISGLANHTTYWIRVRGRNGIGWSGYSGALSAATLGHPTAPQSVTATASTSVTGRVTVNWAAPATTGAGGITGYNVFRDGIQIATITGTTTSHVDNGRTPFTSYSYTIRARNAYSDSVSSYGPLSSAASVTAQGPPSAPLSLSGDSHPTIPGRVDLTWSAPTNTGTGGITGYRVRLAD